MCSTSGLFLGFDCCFTPRGRRTDDSDHSIKDALSIIPLANRYNSIFDNRGREEKRQILKKHENNGTANSIFGRRRRHLRFFNGRSIYSSSSITRTFYFKEQLYFPLLRFPLNGLWENE